MENKEIIEKLNLEYIELLSSKEYKRGKDISKALENIKRGRFIKNFLLTMRRKKISKYNAHNELDNGYDLTYENSDRPRIAVYTVITGNYDMVNCPLVKPSNIDYYFFSEETKDDLGFWKKKSIPNKLSKYDNAEKNRYIKMHPYEFFSNYDYSIYIDGNILVVSDLTDMVCSMTKAGLSLHNHQFRNCVFDEIEVCRLLKKGDYNCLKTQVKKYSNEGFPRKFGLYECNVILCDMKNNKGKKILEDWWNEFLASESYRDQISFPYVVWKNGLKYTDIGCLGKNVYKNPKIRINSHI